MSAALAGADIRTYKRTKRKISLRETDWPTRSENDERTNDAGRDVMGGESPEWRGRRCYWRYLSSARTNRVCKTISDAAEFVIALSDPWSQIVSWKQGVPPVAGWNLRTALENPRPPAVPASLDLTLDEYYAAAGAMGLLAAQLDAPDAEWAASWALDFGKVMADEARRRRLRPVRKGRKERP
jgi:hypothetical protein